MIAEPTLVIAVLTYQRGASLKRTLQSLYQLQVPKGANLRLLVVDNDVARSAEVTVHGATQQSPWPVDYCVAQIRGIPYARNAALEHAKAADYIAFIDDDDIADPQWIAALYATLNNCGADVVAGRMQYRFPPGYEYLSKLDLFANAPSQTGDALQSAWSGNVLFSAKLYREWGLRFDTDFRYTGGSDHHFFATAHRRGAHIVLCTAALVYCDISLARTRTKWLLRRSFRNGATRSMSDKKMHGFRAALGHMRSSNASSLPYFFRLLKGARKGDVSVIHPWLVMCFMLGRISGLMGISPHEYRWVRAPSTLRVAYMLGHFPTLSETFVGNEMRALQAQGHEVFPIALQNPGGAFQEADAALAARTLYFSAMDPDRALQLRKVYRFRRYRAARFMREQTTEDPDHLFVHAAHIAHHIRAQECTHIHAHFAWGAATYAIAAAKLLGLPVTFTCHGSDMYARPQDIALKCAAATAVVAVAPTLSKDIATQCPSARVATIACGVDTDYFHPVTDQSQRHARWLFVGRLVDCKGVADLLAAWQLLLADQRPMLDIVGDGSLGNALMVDAKARGLEAHVQFLGAKPASWIAEHGPRYKAFVAPFCLGSDGARDTAPLVLKEAMAMGLPIVTTRFVDVPFVVGESAILCPAKDAQALAHAVTQLNEMPQEQLLAMSDAARKRALHHFTLHHQADSLVTLFNDCAA